LGATRLCAVLLAAAALTGCRGHQILVPLAPTGETYEWREPVDPVAVCQPALQLTVEVDRPVGYAEARHSPLSAFGISARLRWNSTVQKLCRRLQELCVQHNAAVISVQEFDERRADLDKATVAIGALRSGFLEAVTAYDKAEALLAPDVTAEERPPGVTLAVARTQMEAARERATRAITGATAALAAVDSGRPGEGAAPVVSPR
jgi:hypothetical protein